MDTDDLGSGTRAISDNRRGAILAEALEALGSERFDWRENNCGLMAATLAQAYSGEDFAAEYRPFVEGPLTAMRILRDSGGFAAILADLGLEEVRLPMAKRGDFALLEWTAKGKAREALGVVIDERAAFAGPNGFDYRKTLDCSRAWRVPSVSKEREGELCLR